ncbi:OprO/OprP family phosphate-selective porin [Schlesneria paludicola]|uniref:OprO/OprP family phosphate-selective porin n=1 Tax=Schlesneria paludicola TaxID=360056 RepID=UPI0012F7154C|nr:porin [Schlesneria paludicola]
MPAISQLTSSIHRFGVASSLSALLAGVMCLLPASSCLADDPIQALQQRLDKLEQDNRELRSALSKRSSDGFIPLLTETPPSPDELEDDDQQASDDQSEMGSLVDGYIRRMTEQSRAMEEMQNQKISTLESKLAGVLNKPAPKGTAANGNFGNTGLLFTSNDGNFKTHFGGTAQLDFIAPESQASNIVVPNGAGTPLTQDSTNFRRLRMRADGTMYGTIDWVSEFDFAGFVQNTSQANANLADNGLRSIGTLNGGVQGGNSLNVIQPTTVWMTFKEIPILGNVRVGNQQDWFSIEHITSARYLDFMERAPIMDAFSGPNNNGYTPGVSFFNNTPDKNAGLQMGVYKNNAYDSGYSYSIGNAFTYGGRVIWTPYYDECSEGRYLVHTGFGAQYRTFDTDLALNQNGQNVRLRSRGDLRIASATVTPNFTDTGNFFATGQSLIDPELAVVWGPWTFQAEYTAGWFNGARSTQLAGGIPLDNVFMQGGYVEGLYFLTGENKVYNRQTGLFGQVIPKNNVNFSECKYGAWQVGARYDWMDMNSGLIAGGRNQNGTLGLNWFLNPNIRFQFNTVFSYIDNSANPTIPGPVGSAATGALQGAKFTGEGLIVTVGTRMDISF